MSQWLIQNRHRYQGFSIRGLGFKGEKSSPHKPSGIK